MKRILQIVALAAVLGFAGIQFVRIDRTNPPVEPSKTIESTMNVPPDVQMILSRSCGDCHSNNTVYPWYSNIAPVSWWMRDHIDHGRSHLNFSEWGDLDADGRSNKLEEVCEEVKVKNMPLPSYLWIHHDSVLSESEISTLCNWTDIERKRIVIPES